ncbi:hypothetical protein QTP70_005291 [Hemibagrus guttatus]|uniref:Reverse transcriptase domain-containing protein n=1 Tax=Hemibagrus guttatus TaxID=175788 RepID=A0AAE0Q1P9_9TELE|nr:hypothetical protein QTP70_005291 [Hemibagrus guttatus]
MAVVVNPGLDRSGVIGHQGRIHPEQSANPFTHYGQFRDSNQPRSMSLGCGRKPTKRENMQTPNKLIPLTQQQASAVYFHLPLRCSAGLSGVRAWPGRWLNPGALRGRGTAFAVSGIVGTVAADGDVARMAVADGLGAGARYVVRVAAAEGPTVCAVARMVERAGFGGVPLPTEEVKDRDREENQVVEAEKGGRNVLGVAFGRRKEDKETWWWNEEVQDSIQRKRLAKKKWDMDRSEENRQEYKELQCRVKREVSKAKQKAYDELYTRLDTREGKKDLYRLARQKDRDDLEKTYDRVPREELWYCMRKSGIAEKYVRVVQDMYERSRTVVRCAVGQTEEFKVEVGLHQGSALSPFLFAIVMDQLSEELYMHVYAGISSYVSEMEDKIGTLLTKVLLISSKPELTTTAIGAVDLQGVGGNWATVGRRSRGGRRVHRQREKRKCKSVGLRIGTLNVGTMTGKGRELADMMERRKVDILCVQETRWKGSKARSIGAGFKLFYYGVDSKRNGVGVVLKEEFVRNVLEVKRVSDRVMSLKLEIEAVMLNVVSGYAPQVGWELEEKERFWSELDKVMESIPTGERVVIGADFNGHVGEGNRGDEEVMGKFGVKERNLEGQMVVDFVKRMDMAVVNTYFHKREEHRMTYKSGGRRTQVDYIL